MNEARAIKLCIRYRDPIGFEYLVKKYQREAFGHALALVWNPDDAAEMCQEAFAKAFASLPQLEELTAFYPWFYRILRNGCFNLLRRKRAENKYEQNVGLHDARIPLGPEFLVSSEQDIAAARSALASIKFEFREILSLKYRNDYGYAALSKLLGIPRGTVMSRLYHARKAFRAAYIKHTSTVVSNYGGEANG